MRPERTQQLITGPNIGNWTSLLNVQILVYLLLRDPPSRSYSLIDREVWADMRLVMRNGAALSHGEGESKNPGKECEEIRDLFVLREKNEGQPKGGGLRWHRG